MKRVQFQFSRVFSDRLRVGLNPLITYGHQRKQALNFRKWVPRYSPIGTESSIPSMCLEQRSMIWDWTQGAPERSWLAGLGITLRLRTGPGGWLIASLLDGRNPRRLLAVRAEVPMADPSDVRFSLERTWQVRTTVDQVRR
ncbi:unnamed protein product [Discosporangium mesarthrocarpum]